MAPTRISELLDSLWRYLAVVDAPIHNVPEVLSWIQVCLRHSGTAYTLWPHEAGHFPSPGGTQGPLHQRKFWQWVWTHVHAMTKEEISRFPKTRISTGLDTSWISARGAPVIVLMWRGLFVYLSIAHPLIYAIWWILLFKSPYNTMSSYFLSGWLAPAGTESITLSVFMPCVTSWAIGLQYRALLC